MPELNLTIDIIMSKFISSLMPEHKIYRDVQKNQFYTVLERTYARLIMMKMKCKDLHVASSLESDKAIVSLCLSHSLGRFPKISDLNVQVRFLFPNFSWVLEVRF